jgi:uncharacterized protein with ParB-like and HNH nuclease domain
MSDSTFDAENKVIEEILGDKKSFYTMPNYQRPYAWDKDRVEQLWYDIVEAYTNNIEDPEVDKNYFLGSIVLVNNIKEKSFDVVDGQQRLTTLTILLCTIRDMFPDNEQIDEISDLIISRSKNRKRLRLSPHINKLINFNATIIDGIDFKIDIKSEEYKKNRYLQTAYYFKHLILNSKNQNSENYIQHFIEFLDYLLTKITIIVITCNDTGSAIKLFNVLNDRGMDLSSADIIKSYLLQNEPSEQNQDAIIEVWKKIENELEKYDNEKFSDILNIYLYHLKMENPKKALQEELLTIIKSESSMSVINDIDKFTTNYLSIIDSTHDYNISSLTYLNHSVYWKSILTSAKHLKFNKFDDLKILLKKYYFQSWITDGTANRIKQTSFNILKILKNNYTKKDKNKETENNIFNNLSQIEQIKYIIEENLKEHGDFKNYIMSENAYSKRWAKPILLLLEYDLYEDDTKEHTKDYIPITKTLHLEHVMPQEYTTYYPNITKDDADKNINSLGNLTLLTYKKNSEAGKLPYSDKVKIFRGEKTSSGLTTFEITKQLITNYPDTWGIVEIKERQESLRNDLIKLLRI